MNGVTLRYFLTLETLLFKDGGAAFEQKNWSLDVLACLAVNPLDMPRTPHQASKGKHSQQPTTMPYHANFKSSFIHHSSHQRTALLTTPRHPLTLSCRPLATVHLHLMPPYQPSTPFCRRLQHTHTSFNAQMLPGPIYRPNDTLYWFPVAMYESL